MSTKFSGGSQVQKPPPLCHPPPDDPGPQDPPFPNRTPFGYFRVLIPVETPPVDVVSRIPLHYESGSIKWSGQTTGYPNYINVTLEFFPNTQLLEITIATYRATSLIDLTIFHNVPLATPGRLETRFIRKVTPSPYIIHEVQIFQ